MNPLIRFFLTSLTLTLAFSLSASPLVAQSLVISEFMASNQNSLTDEDGDDDDDDTDSVDDELANSQGEPPLQISNFSNKIS